MTNKTIKIYNTLTKKKDVVKPLQGKKIHLFVCGPTVYDFSHIGHARTCIIFDCFTKYLQSQGFSVYYLQNITDVDDKIILRAREKGVHAKDLATAFEKEYFKNMKDLGVTSVKKYARATDYIKQIISQVKRLQEKGYAYALDDGIYFDISKFKEYGKLSGRTALDAEDSVSRIDYHKEKRNRGDFCLWKFAIEGEPSWPAPFGKGRPGWHIEDTAITEKFLGPQYDIHGGGRDLMFPHHEAEITQMEAISDKKPMAKYWMHTGFLTIKGQKMSKSLNNFIIIDDFLKRYPYQYLRFWVAKNLWHSPVDYSDGAMIEVKISLDKIEEFLRRVKSVTTKGNSAGPATKLFKEISEEFYTSLADDFNTPKAFAALFDLIREANKLLDEGMMTSKEAKVIYQFFMDINDIFDVIDVKNLSQISIPKEVAILLQKREEYRKAQEWQKADEVRAEIEKLGFLVDDTKGGTSVKKV